MLWLVHNHKLVIHFIVCSEGRRRPSAIPRLHTNCNFDVATFSLDVKALQKCSWPYKWMFK